MKGAAFALLVSAMLIVAGAARAGNAVVSLRASAELSGIRYTLGDIADVESSDAALQRTLSGIAIGNVPRMGYTDAVSRADVETVVRRELANNTVEWNGAQLIRIRGRGQHVGAERLSDAAAQALYAMLSKDFTAIEMHPVSGQHGVSVPAGKISLNARVPAAQPVARRMSAMIDVSIDGQMYTTVPVWFAVHASRAALVTKTAMKQGKGVQAADLEVQSVDVTTANAALPSDVPLEAIRLRRGVVPGAVLRASDIEPRPAVSRDEEIVVRVVSGSVTIETTGRALADARIGETVKVKNARTNESYSARVVGDGVAQVSMR